MKPQLRVENRPGQTLRVGITRLVPFAQSFEITLPGFPGGLIWNRPVSVLVQYPDGREEVTLIPDVTRRIQFTLYGIGILGGLFLLVSILNQRIKEKNK